MGWAAEHAMKFWLSSKAAHLTPKVSGMVCSVLANMLYWQESADVLGDARLQQLFARAGRMRARALTPRAAEQR
jgi:hypothetical protein